MEIRRRPPTDQTPTSLPPDYLRMVVDAFGEHFGDTLKLLERQGDPHRFMSVGSLYPDEVNLSVSLVSDKRLAATTVHASCDLDLSDGHEVLEPILALSVDALGSLFAEVLEAKASRPPTSGARGPSDFPPSWSAVEIEGRTVYLLVDGTNPQLEKMADELLSQSDPDSTE